MRGRIRMGTAIRMSGWVSGGGRAIVTTGGIGIAVKGEGLGGEIEPRTVPRLFYVAGWSGRGFDSAVGSGFNR